MIIVLKVFFWVVFSLFLISHIAMGIAVGRSLKRRGLNKFGLPLRRNDERAE